MLDTEIKVLLLENINQSAKRNFKKENYQVKVINSALDEEELYKHIREISVLGIRSKTQITRRILESSSKLLAIGAFCTGVDQIDLDYCLHKGIPVFNAPLVNIRSVAELAIGETIMLMRNLPNTMQAMHRGIWNKSSKDSFEIRGKKLGIIGYGNVGSQLSIMAEAIGMKVYYFDIVAKSPIGNAIKCKSLHELLKISDIVSIHVDGRTENTNYFNEMTFKHMKKGAFLLNLSRGHIVDMESLVENLKNKKLGGAGIDVFPLEPKNNREEFLSELKELPNVILTPHIGGNTQEAQKNVGKLVSETIINYINTGNTHSSINFPNMQFPKQKSSHRLLHIH